MSAKIVNDFYNFSNNNDLLDTENRQKKSDNLYPTNKSDLQKNIEKFNRAKEHIKQTIIASDNSNDKTALYTAITQFKKTNE